VSELDTTAIGVVAARLMEEIAEDYPEGAELEAVGVVVDISSTDDEDNYSAVRWKFGRGDDGRPLSVSHSSGIAEVLHQRLRPGLIIDNVVDTDDD
jgi:hypothetical protein